MRKVVLLAVVAVALALSPVILIQGSDAEVVQDQTFYCYGDNPKVVPIWPMSDDDTWTVTDENGNGVLFDPNEDGSITVHLADEDGVVTVVQRVGQDESWTRLIPIHLPQDTGDDDGRYTVAFHVDGVEVSHTVIDGNRVVEEGREHAYVPPNPTKSGYLFEGWFNEDGSEFDPLAPVRGDTDVHARWIQAGGSVTVNETHVVTFDIVAGLEYSVVSKGDNSVVFSVGVMDGYVLDGDIRVTSSPDIVMGSDGLYMLSGIASDVHVIISGDVQPELTPGGYLVTFEVTDGLSYSLVSMEAGSVSFTVSTIKGYELNGSPIVTAGSDVLLPSDGVYTLSGITGDTVVRIDGDIRYTEGGGTVVIDKMYVIAFDVASGLEYDVVSVGRTSVMFTVSVSDGYRIDGEPEVTSDVGSIVRSGDCYSLVSVDSDAIVSIDGNVFPEEGPGPVPVDPSSPSGGGDGFPWIWVIIAIIIIALSVIILMRHHYKG